MREREDIELDKRTEVYGYAEIHQVILEVLLDIREYLRLIPKIRMR